MDVHAELPHATAGAAGSGRWAAPVLVDGGDDMWLVWVRFPEPPRAGLTFWFRGSQWQLERTEAFGCRAVPAAM
jgi:hypothetical protein